MPSVIRAVGTEINLVDLFALEAVRVLKPEVFDRLLGLSAVLTYTSSGIVGGRDDSTRRREVLKPELDALIAAGGSHSEAVRDLLNLVFPGSESITGNMFYGSDTAQQWRRERRVAHPEVFAIYFSRALPRGAIESALVEAVFSAFGNPEQLEELLAGLPTEDIEALLGRLEDFEQEFPEDPTTAIVAISNLTPRLPRLERHGMFELDLRLRLQRVVLRLLRKVEPEGRRDEVVRDVYPRLGSLTGKFWLVQVAGRRENVGSNLISESSEVELLGQLRDEIKSANPVSLADERDVLRLLALVRETKDPSDADTVRSMLNSDELILGTLRSSLSENLSNSVGDITVQREAVLSAWTWLETLIGAEELVQRIDRLTAPDHADEATVLTIKTAKRYSGGWRPEWFGRTRPEPAEGDGATVEG